MLTAMSKHASPTAQLLRNSRLFSLPQALPRPINEIHLRDGYFRSSDTATTPYPLRQAIITPKSSASRGDWGLKRPLPQRAATRSSEPVHNVIANDTYESVTDYNSATPHVKTLQRFQELEVALMRQDRKIGVRTVAVSALEASLDFTDKGESQDKRWKYENANFRTMTPGEFDAFLEKNVASKRDEFMALLQARFHRQQLNDKYEREKVAIETGDAFGEENSRNFDTDSYTAIKAYNQWVLEMSDADLCKYLALAQRALIQRGQRTEDQEQPVLPEFAEQILTLAFDANQISSIPEIQELAASTYSHALQEMLKASWWTRELEEDSSHEGELLRQKLYSTTVGSSDKVLPVSRPAIGNANATKWIKFLGLVEKHEKQFLRTWVTNEWDMDGTLFSRNLHTLRHDITLESPLNKLIREFLDLPPTRIMPSVKLVNIIGQRATENAYSLTTHPTAGLSYLRTNNIMHNHPILGPQKMGPPVKSRFIANTDGGRVALGVAGFVTEEPGQGSIDVTTPGGVKLERHVKGAHVDADGRIQIELASTRDNEALGVREGRLARDPVEKTSSKYGEGLAKKHLWGSKRKKHIPSRAKPYDASAVDSLKNLNTMLQNARASKPTS